MSLAGGRHRQPQRRTMPVWIAAFVACALGSAAAVAATVSGSASAQTSLIGIYTGHEIPANPAENDAKPVELGVQFNVNVPGTVVAIRYYKSAQNRGTHTGNLWTARGVKQDGRSPRCLRLFHCARGQPMSRRTTPKQVGTHNSRVPS